MTSATIPTLDEVAALLKGAMREIGSRLGPDDDWAPVMFLQHRLGTVMEPILLTDSLASVGTRQAFYISLPSLVSATRSRLVAIIQPQWASKVSPNADGSPVDLDDRPHPSEDPNRVEQLSLALADAERLVVWDAVVTRTAVGPALGEWRLADPAGGMMIDALRKAFA